jgi:hypothetical protein
MPDSTIAPDFKSDEGVATDTSGVFCPGCLMSARDNSPATWSIAGGPTTAPILCQLRAIAENSVSQIANLNPAELLTVRYGLWQAYKMLDQAIDRQRTTPWRPWA